MEAYPITGKQAYEQELLRRSALQKLADVRDLYGEEQVSRVLLAVSIPSVVEACRRWHRAEGDLFLLLSQSGVHVKFNGRAVEVTDAQGTFDYVDDYFFSYTTYMCLPFAEKYQMVVPMFQYEREPHSLKDDIVASGRDPSDRPLKQAVDYLVELHKTGNYGDTLKLKLQGGDFKRVRPISLVKTPLCIIKKDIMEYAIDEDEDSDLLDLSLNLIDRGVFLGKIDMLIQHLKNRVCRKAVVIFESLVEKKTANCMSVGLARAIRKGEDVLETFHSIALEQSCNTPQIIGLVSRFQAVLSPYLWKEEPPDF